MLLNTQQIENKNEKIYVTILTFLYEYEIENEEGNDDKTLKSYKIHKRFLDYNIRMYRDYEIINLQFIKYILKRYYNMYSNSEINRLVPQFFTNDVDNICKANLLQTINFLDSIKQQ